MTLFLFDLVCLNEKIRLITLENSMEILQITTCDFFPFILKQNRINRNLDNNMI